MQCRGEEKGREEKGGMPKETLTKTCIMGPDGKDDEL